MPGVQGVQVVPGVFWMFLSIFMIFFNLYGRSVGGARRARLAYGLDALTHFMNVLKHFL